MDHRARNASEAQQRARQLWRLRRRGGSRLVVEGKLNAGPLSAASVSVTDPLPAGTTFVSCSTSQGTCSGPPVGTNGTVTATLGTIASAGSATFTIVVNVTASTQQHRDGVLFHARSQPRQQLEHHHHSR